MRSEESADTSRRPTFVATIVVTAVAMLVIVALVVVVPPIFAPADRFPLAADAIKAQNDVRLALLQSIAGVGVLVGFYFTWRQLAETRRQAEQTSASTRAQLSLAVQQQVNDQLAAAIQQLGHENQSVQIAGVSMLELAGTSSGVGLGRTRPNGRDRAVAEAVAAQHA